MPLVIYDPSIWTEFGYIVQSYMGSAINVALPMLALVVGLYLLVQLILAIVNFLGN